MIEIENKDKVLDRINKLARKGDFRLSCEFCAGPSYDYLISPYLVEIDGCRYVKYFCKTCGNTLLLDYDVLMKIKTFNNGNNT